MTSRIIVLYIAALALLAGFFLLPKNLEWARTVISYGKDFQSQRKALDRETRMRKRFGNDYIISKDIADFFDRKGIKNEVLVLMPTTNYFKQRGFSYHVPEPAVFYYYTGLKTVWADSKEAVKANWYVTGTHGKLTVESITDRKAILDTIALYRKTGVTL